ncbi:MAG TPA: tetratricopeptide repeat protein [Planctomycetota bacterium]|nr:tetratricopeptide repeat protein [Planctomycetota bacterium]
MKPARALLLLALLPAGCWPNNPDAPEETALERFQMAEEYLAGGHYYAAAIEYEFVVRHRWRWKEPYIKLARCYESLGRDEDAIADLERLLVVDSRDEDALRSLGRLYAKRGDAARAIAQYRQLRTLHPEDRSLDGEIARLEALGKP